MVCGDSSKTGEQRVMSTVAVGTTGFGVEVLRMDPYLEHEVVAECPDCLPVLHAMDLASARMSYNA